MPATPTTHLRFGLAICLVAVGACVIALAGGCELIAGVRPGELAPQGHSGANGGTGGSAPSGGTGGSTPSGGTGGSTPSGGTGGSTPSGGTGGSTSSGGSGGASTSGGGTPTGGGGSSYAAAVLSDGPIAYWRLGEQVTPTAYDSSANGHDGIYQGVTLGEPGALAGDPDTAARFDESGWVDFGDHFGFEGNVPFSVELWIKPESHSEGFAGKSHYDTGTGYSGWFLVENVGPEYPLDFYRGGAVAGPSLAQGTYSYVVGAYDGVNLMLYVDGQLVAQEVVSDPLPVNPGTFTVGAVDGWGVFGGAIDEVALYDKYLAPARILAHYQVGTGQ